MAYADGYITRPRRISSARRPRPHASATAKCLFLSKSNDFGLRQIRLSGRACAGEDAAHYPTCVDTTGLRRWATACRPSGAEAGSRTVMHLATRRSSCPCSRLGRQHVKDVLHYFACSTGWNAGFRLRVVSSSWMRRTRSARENWPQSLSMRWLCACGLSSAPCSPCGRIFKVGRSTDRTLRDRRKPGRRGRRAGQRVPLRRGGRRYKRDACATMGWADSTSRTCSTEHWMPVYAKRR